MVFPDFFQSIQDNTGMEPQKLRHGSALPQISQLFTNYPSNSRYNIWDIDKLIK
jgi:hypothetical protein